MTDRVVQITTKDLQAIYRTVNIVGNSWESVKWHRYRTVPGHDPEKQGMIRIKASKGDGIGRYVFEMQKGGNQRKAQCDVHISCKGGFVPCHRAILMHFSPLLKTLIVDNMKETGVPTPEHPIFIAMKDFKLEDMELALSFLYTGYTSFRVENVRQVVAILEFLKVEHNCEVEPVNPELVKKRKQLLRYKDLSPSGDESEEVEVDDANSKAEADKDYVPPAGQQRESRKKNKTRPSQVSVKKEAVSPARSSSVSSLSSHRTSKRSSPLPGTSKDPQRNVSRQNTSRRVSSDNSSSDSDDLFEEVPKSKLTKKPVGSKAAGNTTLAERVKLKSRSAAATTPTPEKKKAAPFTVNLSNVSKRPKFDITSTQAASQDSSSNTAGAAQGSSSNEPAVVIGASSNSVVLEEKPVNGGRNKCFFCSVNFPTEEELLQHVEDCGVEIKGLYVFETKQCLLCLQSFPVFSHFGLARHVAECKQVNGDRRPVSGIRTLNDFVADLARNPAAAGGDSRPGFERFPLGIPIVVIERLGDRRIVRIAESVERGEKVDIPRLQHYNYVKGRVKKEPPEDLTKGMSVDELHALKRKLEREQIESKGISEDRRRMKAGKIPPLRINRERILSGDQDITQNANEWFLKLTVCSHCSETYESIDAATKCVKGHGLKRCWVCLDLMSKDSPIENHYRTAHNTLNTPGELLCPICKVPCKYVNVAKHLKLKHFKSLEKHSYNPIEESSTAVSSVASTSHGKRRCAAVPVSYAEEANDSGDEQYSNMTFNELLRKNVEYEALLEKHGPHSEKGQRVQQKIENLKPVLANKYVREDASRLIAQEPDPQVGTDAGSVSPVPKKKSKPVSRKSRADLTKIKMGPKSRMQALAKASLISGLLNKDTPPQNTPAPQKKLPAATKRKIGPKSKTRGRGRPKKPKVDEVPIATPQPVQIPHSPESNENSNTEATETRPVISNEVKKADLMARIINRKLGESNEPTTAAAVCTSVHNVSVQPEQRTASISSSISQVTTEQVLSSSNTSTTNPKDDTFHAIAMSVLQSTPKTAPEEQSQTQEAVRRESVECIESNVTTNLPVATAELENDMNAIRTSPSGEDDSSNESNNSVKIVRIVGSTGVILDQETQQSSDSSTSAPLLISSLSIPPLILQCPDVAQNREETSRLILTAVAAPVSQEVSNNSSNSSLVSNPPPVSNSVNLMPYHVPNPLLRRGQLNNAARMTAPQPAVTPAKQPPHTAAILTDKQRGSFDRSRLPFGTPVTSSVPRQAYMRQQLPARQATHLAPQQIPTSANITQSSVPCSSSPGVSCQASTVFTRQFPMPNNASNSASQDQRQLVPYNQGQHNSGFHVGSNGQYNGRHYFPPIAGNTPSHSTPVTTSISIPQQQRLDVVPCNPHQPSRSPQMSLSYTSLQISSQQSPAQLNSYLGNDGISRMMMMEQVHQLNQQVQHAFHPQQSSRPVPNLIQSQNGNLASISQPVIFAEGITVAAPATPNTSSELSETSSNALVAYTEPESAEHGVERPVTELFKLSLRNPYVTPVPVDNSKFCSSCRLTFSDEVNYNSHYC